RNVSIRRILVTCALSVLLADWSSSEIAQGSTSAATRGPILAARNTATGPQAEFAVYLPLIVSATSAGAPVISSFTASRASIAPGGSSTLSWNVSGATSLSISPAIGAVTGTSTAVSPAITTDYTLTASNAAGSTTAKAVVAVVSPEPERG